MTTNKMIYCFKCRIKTVTHVKELPYLNHSSYECMDCGTKWINPNSINEIKVKETELVK